MTKKFGDYYLGLDIGTDSVGWAVADKDYNILNFNGKAMWGIHLFDSGNTAEDRRIHRIARRRLERRKQRIELLQDIFADEMNKIDPDFFERLSESRFVVEDRKHSTHDTLFNDPSFKDKDYFKKYPTIYHVRNALMEWNEKEKPDIRLLYLACHHIIKYRGHFLYENLSSGDIPPFEIVFEELIKSLNSECGTEIEPVGISSSAKEILSDKKLGVKEKTKKLHEILIDENFPDLIEELCKLLSGGTANLDNMFGNNDADSKLDKLTFKNTDFDEAIAKLEGQIPEKIEILTRAKTIYDWALLNDLLDGNGRSISKAKIKTYEQHREDLKLLKSILKEDSGKYYDVFKSEDIEMKINNKNIKVNYSAYSGIHKKGTTDTNVCSQADFCKYLRTVVFKKEFGDSMFTNKFACLVEKINNDTFMPKQTIKDNSLFPNALHQHELKEILENMEKYYPFLNEKDESEYNSKQKIIKICTFKIPYYVGPLNQKSERSWLERKEGKITPWNFEKKVDLDKSAENFMKELIGNCTYLKGEKVVPKRSLMYQRFELYNEINTLKIADERLFSIDPRLKQDFVKDLLETDGSKKVTKKVIENWLRKKCQYHKDDEVGISGIDNEIKSSLKSEKQLRGILGSQMNRKIAEDIIRLITVFGGDRSRMKAKLETDYSEILDSDQIDKLSKLTFKDWGRLSEKFLTGIYAAVNGEEMNILMALEKTSMNLQELLSENYGFKKQIDELNETDNTNNSITYDLLDDLYVSPKVKRGIWRSLRIIQDILKITDHPPVKVFIETTRENQESKRTVSRKDNLVKLYDACKKESSDINSLLNELNETEEGRLRSKDLYAYYTQHGKCMYCGQKIDLNDLSNNSKYDLDHIHPRSLKADDSLHNNLVLVCKTCNQEKGKTYPLKPEWQKNRASFWKFLKDKEFITKEKYERLIRTKPFDEDELSGFINRQLVETSQSVKAVAEILKRVFGDKTDVVYVKANTVSDFRNGNNGCHGSDSNNRLKFIKCRSVNDYHHAKDAYLNIVVGNVYDTKFTKNYKSFVQSGGTYNFREMFDSNIERNGVQAWKAGDDGTIATVQKYMRRNNILFTRFTQQEGGQLFDVNPLKKTEKTDRKLPLKNKDLLVGMYGESIQKYGGYDNIKGAYFILAEHYKKETKTQKLHHVPIYLSSKKSEAFQISDIIEHLYEKNDVESPTIVIMKILFKSLFEINGFRLHITGRSNERIKYICAEQLLLSDEDYEFCKKIEKYATKEMKVSLPASAYGLTVEAETVDDNPRLHLYDTLLNKLKGKYNVFYRDNVAKNVEEKKDVFKTLSPEDQVKTLSQILNAFKCNAETVNLKSIGGPGNTGIIQLNSNLDSFDSIKLIHQSPSGLFENEIDLKKL